MEIFGLIGLFIVAIPVLFIIIMLVKIFGGIFMFMTGVVVRFFFAIIAAVFFLSFICYLVG